MNYNINLLKNFTLLYVCKDDNLEEKSKSFQNFFNHVFTVENYQKAREIYEKSFNKLDLILLEVKSLEEQELQLLDRIRYQNKIIPIILIIDEVNKEILDKGLEYNINSFLLRPLKVQELSKLAVVKIQKYHRKQKMKDSLKILSHQISILKDENENLLTQNQYQLNKANFIQNLHNNFLNSIAVNNRGVVESVSSSIQNKFNENVIGNNINKIFQNPSSIQKAMLISVKERKIVSVNDFILSNTLTEYNINIMPNFTEDDEVVSYTIFFNKL